MPGARLRALLGLLPGEARPLIALGVVHLALGGACAAGDVAVQTVFIARIGADSLPHVLLIRALLGPVVALIYMRTARQRSPRSVLALLALITSALSLFAPTVMGWGPAGPIATYAAHELASGLLIVHWGVYLLAHLREDAARRGVALVYGASRAGAALAGAASAPLAQTFGAPEVMYLAAALFVLVAVLAEVVSRGPLRPVAEGDEERLSMEPEAPHVPSRPPPPPSRRGAPLLVALCLATASMVVARFALRFQQQELLEGYDEVVLAGVLGVYTFGGNIVGLILQVAVTGRLLSKLGLTRANLVYPLGITAGQIAILAGGGLGAALTARFADTELKHAVKTPVSPLFYEVFDHGDRGPARAVVLQVVSPITQVVTSAALTGLVFLAREDTMAWIGAGGALAYLAATLLQNRRYEQAIRRDSLRGRGGPRD